MLSSVKFYGITLLTLLLLSPPWSLKRPNEWTVSRYKTRDYCWKKAFITCSTAQRILSILTCISPRPDLDTRLPVASKYSIWCDMLVLLDMDCNKVAVKVETILQWGKKLATVVKNWLQKLITNLTTVVKDKFLLRQYRSKENFFNASAILEAERFSFRRRILPKLPTQLCNTKKLR